MSETQDKSLKCRKCGFMGNENEFDYQGEGESDYSDFSHETNSIFECLKCGGDAE